jgi:hypothetical protein
MYVVEVPIRAGLKLHTSLLPNSNIIIRRLRKYSMQRCSFSVK